MAIEVKNFDPKSVPLAGTNLIEASAGTGKTYSIAILVLRILLEIDIEQEEEKRNISIKEILMVTFTKAAVAELEQRVRLFVRKAYFVCQNGYCDDDTITEVVLEAIAAKNEKEVERRLFEAITFLDEASVQTIHSFCQQILREFAFETRQSFSVELVTDMSLVINSELNQFWRSRITVLPVDILQLLRDMLTRDKLKIVIEDYFAGKPIYDYDPAETYVLDNTFFEHCRTRVAAIKETIKEIEAQMLTFCGDKMVLDESCKKDRHAKTAFAHLTDAPEQFLGAFLEKYRSNNPQYLKKLFGDLFELAELIEVQDLALRHAQFELLHYIYAAAISFVGPAVTAYKEKHGQLCFDDLIEQLHTRLCKEDNPALIAAIQKKFKVVFIDEFQDTDSMQYEIFNTAFGKNTVVFYIGDPKQSIYAWRKADIDTYLKAGEQVDNKYGMHVNYRSSNDFIQAMNGFFMPTPEFDTFYYRDSALGIQYHEVDAPGKNKKGRLLYKEEAFPVISVAQPDNAEGVVEALTAQLAALLSGDYSIESLEKDAQGTEHVQKRPIKPTDIGILVRTNKAAVPIKKQLSKLGIPSVVIGDAKILASEEAKEVLYILEAMMSQSRNTINKALLTSLTGLSVQSVLKQEDVITIERFGAYKAAWEKSGVYKALFSFIADYEVESYLTDPRTRGGERVISNLYQLIELLYKQQSNKNLSPVELTDWLRRNIEDPRAQGDEYEQRVESDDQCVTIMTVHKSKGLQFNIVLTPAMDLRPLSGQEEFLVFKNIEGVDEVLPRELLIGEDLETFERQRMQENRRMIYVTLTRGVYASFIYTSFKAPGKSSFAIYDFLEAFKTNPPIGVRFMEPLPFPEAFKYKKEKTRTPGGQVPNKDEVTFELLQKDWRKLSYTYLAAPPAVHGRFEVRALHNAYDQFVFQELRRGNITGNLLHDIFEHIYFEQPAFWPEVVKKAVLRYAPQETALYEPMILELVKHVSNAHIITDTTQFSLNQTNYERRLNEFEFDFPIKQFARRDLVGLLGDTALIQSVAAEGWEGMMNGKIDMLFEHVGKYYVLDWKSTFLGSGMDNYAPEHLELEMARHNYHLQYLIYTVATTKYLQDRLGDFDYDRDFGGVLYYFVRGVRADQSTGIYFAKPDKNVIDSLLELWTEKGSEMLDL